MHVSTPPSFDSRVQPGASADAHQAARTSQPARGRRRRLAVTPRDARPRVSTTRSVHEIITSLQHSMDELVSVVSVVAAGASGVAPAGGGAGEVAVVLTAERRRLDAALAAVVGVHAAGSEWAADGFSTPKAWLRARTGEGASAAGRLMAQSRALEVCPLMAAAWADGTVSWSHVAVLADAHRRFPRLSPGLTQIEGDLAFAATGVEPEEFARILFEHLHGLDPEAVDEADASKRRDSVSLHVSRMLDGYVRVDGLLPPEIGESLLTALAAAREKARRDFVEFGVPSGPDQPTLGQRNAQALAHILDAAASVRGANGLPGMHGQRPVLHVTIPTESLTAEPGAPDTLPGWIEDHTGAPVTPITAEGARRLACDATTRLISLDPRGCIDAIFASTRTIPARLRRYILTRDGGRCRFPGCHQHIHEIHHVVHWAHGGSTTSDNLIGLCHHHHHLSHEGGWQVRGNPELEVGFIDSLGRRWASPPLE